MFDFVLSEVVTKSHDGSVVISKNNDTLIGWFGFGKINIRMQLFCTIMITFCKAIWHHKNNCCHVN